MEQGSIAPKGMSLRHARVPYKDQTELFGELLAALDSRIWLVYKYSAHNEPKDAPFRTAADRFEASLGINTELRLFDRATAEERDGLDNDTSYILSRLEKSNGSIPLVWLYNTFSLSVYQLLAFTAALAPTLDPKYSQIYAFLQSDASRTLLELSLALRVCAPADSTISGLERFLRTDSLFALLFDYTLLREGRLRPLPRVWEFLSLAWPEYPAGLTNLLAEEPEPLLIRKEIKDELKKALLPDDTAVMLSGPPLSGKKLLLAHAARELGTNFAMLDFELWKDEPERGIRLAALEAVLLGGSPCLYHFPKPTGNEEHSAADAMTARALEGWRHFGCICIMSEEPYKNTLLSEGRTVIHIDIPPTTQQERSTLLDAFRGDAAIPDATELTDKFRFEPGQIKSAVRQITGIAEALGTDAADAATVHRCFYDQIIHKLAELASPVKAAYTWDDLVLPSAQKELMREACDHMRYGHIVYGEWRMSEQLSYGKGLTMLFAGPPGTGKTMGAQVIANQLHMEMYKIQISQVMSKYIGETEKNLEALFKEARRSSCILFFDECDALFGKRSEVKDSHDRYANVETAYLLQQMEEFDGITILATNLQQNLDAAFMRRIGFVVHFPLPNADYRAMLYKKLLPKSAPLSDDINFDFLAERFDVSGGSIKNITTNAAFLAAREQKPIDMRHLLRAAVNELKKNEIVVVRSDLREYAELVFG